MKKIKQIVKEEIQLFLNEYLDKYHDIPLKQYLSLSDDEKINDMIYQFEPYILNFFTELYDDGIIDGDIMEYVESLDEDDLAEELINGKLSNFRQQFINFLERTIDYNEMPAYQTFDGVIPIKNEWLIHFTNDALDIARYGFEYGTDDMNRLNYTNAGVTDGKYEGYDFAYTVDDFSNYYRSSFTHEPKYGNEAVIFQASGIKTWHYGDEEYQVIFWGRNAKNIIPISRTEDGNWIVYSSKTGNPIIQFEDVEDIVQWVMNNKEQYRKHLYHKR